MPSSLSTPPPSRSPATRSRMSYLLAPRRVRSGNNSINFDSCILQNKRNHTPSSARQDAGHSKLGVPVDAAEVRDHFRLSIELCERVVRSVSIEFVFYSELSDCS